MEMAVKTVKGAARGAGRHRRQRGELLPAAGIMGERRPLAPFLHGFLGALPHGYGAGVDEFLPLLGCCQGGGFS